MFPSLVSLFIIVLSIIAWTDIIPESLEHCDVRIDADCFIIQFCSLALVVTVNHRIRFNRSVVNWTTQAVNLDIVSEISLDIVAGVYVQSNGSY